jgi:hypothetical protein
MHAIYDSMSDNWEVKKISSSYSENTLNPTQKRTLIYGFQGMLCLEKSPI